MRPQNCSECKHLEDEVTDWLEKLRQLTTTQLAVFREGNQSEFMRLDRELENMVGEKERRVGVLCASIKETTTKQIDIQNLVG